MNKEQKEKLDEKLWRRIRRGHFSIQFKCFDEFSSLIEEEIDRKKISDRKIETKIEKMIDRWRIENDRWEIVSSFKKFINNQND